jgi:hypothetical protein
MEHSSDTTNLFRPNQVQEAREELRRLNETLQAPSHIRGKISDPREMSKRAKRLAEDIQKYEPRAYPVSEKDAATREFRELTEQIAAGMPSSEEMRRNPPGAVEKHMAWEKRAKQKIARWKHVGLRLEVGGDVPADLAVPGASINIEVLRQHRSNRDLSMDGAQIPKGTDYHFGADPVGAVVFSEDELAVLREIAPAVAGSLGVLGNDARAEIKAMVTRAMAPAETVSAPETSAPSPTAKPEMKDIGFNDMKKMAAENGMNVFGATKTAIATWLRARHLIR